MNGERYLVELEFKRIGDMGLTRVDAQLKRAEKGFDAFKRGWNDLRGSVAPVGAAMDSVVKTAMGFARVGAMVGGTALLAGATYGVVGLNNQLEKATISLGTIFSAQGMASSVPAGMERAKNLISQMRVDAQKLPGEFEELMNIFTTGAIPAFRSGASIDQFRDLSAKAMAAGKVANMDMGQVAREFAQLLEGRSGAHNVFGMKLLGLSGDSAQKFNSQGADKRFATISSELDKYTGAIDAFSGSFDAQSSTLIDNFKNFGRDATAPLFESVKQTLAEANAWFADNKEEVRRYAVTIGYALRDGFIEGKKFLQEYGPLVLRFAEGASIKFHEIWYDIEQIAESLGLTGDSIKAALSDPDGTIDKLIHLAKLYAGFKVAQGVVGLGGGLLGAANGIGGMMGAAGMLGGGAAAGAGAAGVAGGAGALAIAAAGAAFIAALGGVTAAIYQFQQLRNDQEDEHKKNSQARADAAVREIQEMQRAGMSEEHMQQRTNELHDQFIARGQNMADAMMEVQLASLQAAGALRSIDFQGGAGKGITGMGNEDWSKPLGYAFDPMTFNAKFKPPDAEPETSAAAKAHKPRGGGGGTIQKVEIVITQNQHPSRIARAVVGHIGRLARNPTSSPDVKNFSSLEDG